MARTPKSSRLPRLATWTLPLNLLDPNQPPQALALLKILILQLKDIINTDSQIETIKRPSPM
jgi:hypothetical protein